MINVNILKVFIPLLLLSQMSFLLAENYSTLEVRAAALFPAEHRFKDVYGDVQACYEVEFTTKAYGCLDAWLNVDWFSRHGKSNGFDSSTRLRVANISFGVKIPYRICTPLEAYVGIGPSFGGVWIKNDLFCTLEEHTSKFAIGGVLKLGINYFITPCVFFDLFVDYLFQRVDFEKHVNIGGIKTGIGTGVKF